jgi:hypothetical protein
MSFRIFVFYILAACASSRGQVKMDVEYWDEMRPGLVERPTLYKPYQEQNLTNSVNASAFLELQISELCGWFDCWLCLLLVSFFHAGVIRSSGRDVSNTTTRPFITTPRA